MKQRLKLHLWRTNATVYLQVLEQENIREDLSDKIHVNKGPELLGFNIHLRGIWQNRTDCITNLPLDTEQNAIDYINEVVSWLDEVFPAKEPKAGEMVEVSHCKNGEQVKRIFLFSLQTLYSKKKSYVCVANGHENLFKSGKHFNLGNWEYMQPINSNWNPETGIYEAEREV